MLKTQLVTSFWKRDKNRTKVNSQNLDKSIIFVFAKSFYTILSSLLILNIFYNFFNHSVFTVHFEQVNAGCVQNMYVSSRLNNHILATRKTRKGVTLYEVKHQNHVEVGAFLFKFQLWTFALLAFLLQLWVCILFAGVTLLT